MSRRMLPLGDHALLAQVDTLDDVLALHAALAATRPAGIVDIVPAARTVAVMFDPAVIPLEAAREWVVEAKPVEADSTGENSVTIDVDYDGDDLPEVARLLGVSVEEVIRRHTESTWRVAFGGFALGFGYLVTDHDRLVVPRRDSPRTSVPAGSVALAGEFSGVYPRSGPGGWQVIGRTDAALWDSNRVPPALLQPGAAVRFRRATAPIRAAPASAPAQVQEHDPSTNVALTVTEPGPLALIEDLGRPGNAALGAARSGALDRDAISLANRIVGNPENAAALEIAAGGFVAAIRTPTWFAVTGAHGTVMLDDTALEVDTAVRAEPGQHLQIGTAERGLRYYLAVRGGIAVPTELGSRSRDVLTELGPKPLRPGDDLTTGAEPEAPIPAIDTFTVAAPQHETVTIRLRQGPREEWFTRESLARLYNDEWVVSADSNRVGLRLLPREGAAPLERAVTGELPSEAMVPGAIQVPPSGEPTVLLADHPTTGGYPVIAVVADASLDAFAQLRPGQAVAFRHAR